MCCWAKSYILSKCPHVWYQTSGVHTGCAHQICWWPGAESVALFKSAWQWIYTPKSVTFEECDPETQNTSYYWACTKLVIYFEINICLIFNLKVSIFLPPTVWSCTTVETEMKKMTWAPPAGASKLITEVFPLPAASSTFIKWLWYKTEKNIKLIKLQLQRKVGRENDCDMKIQILIDFEILVFR